MSNKYKKFNGFSDHEEEKIGNIDVAVYKKLYNLLEIQEADYFKALENERNLMNSTDDEVKNRYLNFMEEEGDRIDDIFEEHYDGHHIFAVQLLVSQLFIEKNKVDITKLN